MSNNSSITPERFFPVFANELWHNIRKNGFGVSVQNGYSAIITVQETILCTIDFRGRINPDKTFLPLWDEEYNSIQDKLIYTYLTTLHSCLNRLTTKRLGVDEEEDTFDLLTAMILEYSPIDDEEDEDSEGKTDEHPGLHFLDPEEDHAPTEEMPEEWPGFTVGIHRNKCHPCPIKLALGLAGSTALAAILIRKRH